MQPYVICLNSTRFVVEAKTGAVDTTPNAAWATVYTDWDACQKALRSVIGAKSGLRQVFVALIPASAIGQPVKV